MKYRNLDIKTVDTFFEIFSDPKAFTKRMGEMKVVRDEIREELGKVGIKDGAEKLAREAANKMADARDYEKKSRAEITVDVDNLSVRVKNHKVLVGKERNDLDAEKIRFAAVRAEFERTSKALDKDLNERELSVSAREDRLNASVATFKKRKAEHDNYVKQVKAAI